MMCLKACLCVNVTVCCLVLAEEAPKLAAAEPQQQEQQQGQQQQQQGSSGDDGYFRFLGLKISKDDLLTITLALAISYGIRW
jgi:hypothetical protein